MTEEVRRLVVLIALETLMLASVLSLPLDAQSKLPLRSDEERGVTNEKDGLNWNSCSIVVIKHGFLSSEYGASGAKTLSGTGILRICPTLSNPTRYGVRSAHLRNDAMRVGVGDSWPQATSVDKESKSSSGYTQDHAPNNPSQGIFYRNKVELSFEGGWLPINVPFPFDFLLGGGYNFSGLYYTLVPVIASFRWQIDDVGGPWILRGNWDATFSASATAIPRGAESHYFSYMMGVRRNFVPRRCKVSPYWDGQVGLGEIDAKGPLGVMYAQGQNFTFTLNLGSGIRYNFNPKYSIEGGVHYMHISNLYLSEPKFLNNGINVYGPWAGINIRLSKPPQSSSR